MGKRLLLTSAGTAASNNVVRSLRTAHPPFAIIGCHDDRFILKRSTVDRQYLVPAPIRVDFVSALRQLIKAADIDLVMPVSDADVRLMSSLRRQLPARLFLPRPRTIALCQDKYALSVFLRERGLPAPLTFPVTNTRRIARLFRMLARGRPVWCRIRRGSGAIGAVRVGDPEQALNWIRCWQALRGVRTNSFTLSEYLPGRDFTCQSLWHDGTLILVKTAERLSYFGTGSQPGVVSSVATLAKTVYAPTVVETCSRAVHALDGRASGVFSIDLRENMDGVPYITEINAGRLSSGTNLLDLTGKYNMAVAYARLALGEPVGCREMYDVVQDYYMLRDLDGLPAVHHAEEFFEGIHEASISQSRADRRGSPTKEARHGLATATTRAAEASGLP